MKLTRFSLVLCFFVFSTGMTAQAQDAENDTPADTRTGDPPDQPDAAEQGGPEQSEADETQKDTEEQTGQGCDCPPEEASEPAKPKTGFGGEGGLGWIVSSGNTNNESFNGNLGLKYRRNAWQHGFAITAKRVEEEQVTTAERYLLTAQSDYNYGENAYAFVAARYDDDQFDGFEYHASLTTGLGWHILNRDDHRLDLELGAGYRRSEPTIETLPDEETGNLIGRFAEHYEVTLGESTRLFQDLLVESGETNTASEFGVGLKVSMNSRLALQISYSVKHNSDPPPGDDPLDPTLKTDRTTRVTLVFGF